MIDKNEMKKKGMKGVKTIIFGRTLIVVFAFLVQFALLTAISIWLREYSYIFYLIFIVLSVSVVLHLFNSSGSPEFKLVWMLPLIIFPVFGALFYLYVYTQLGTKMLFRRLRFLSGYTKQYVPQNMQVKARLKERNPQMGHFADYMEEYDNSPVYDHTQVTYYPLGDDQFVDMLEELKKAEKFIFLEFFIVEEGEMWNSILDILKEKAKAGVEVRVMYDGMCVLALLPYFYPKVLQAQGIQCKMFAPIRPVFSTYYNNRDHRKIMVIDGKVAFTGGTNLADEYINRKVRFGHWKDTAVRLKGKAAERFTYMFLEMWNVTEMKEEHYLRYKTPENFSMPNDGFVIPYEVSPYGKERVGKKVYLDILNTAEKYVHIMTPYLILDYEMIMALTYAAKRGIDVAIIMPHIPDKIYAFAVAKTYYNELLDAGVKIYEYEPGFVHAKVFVSDDTKAVVGTINLDYRSLFHHFECGALLYENSQIAAVEEDFRNTLKKCIKIKAGDYQKQKLYMRVIGKVLRMFAPLM